MIVVKKMLISTELLHFHINTNQEKVNSHLRRFSGGQSTQIKYLSKSTDTYTKILLQ